MTAHPAIPFLLLAFAAGSWADQNATARFANQDVLSGLPVSFSSGKLIWDSDLLERQASFPLDRILEVTLPARVGSKPVDHVALVKLTNGDSVRGQLASVNDESVSIDTWFAGRLDFRRVMVSSIKIEEVVEYLYQGPTSIEDWIQSSKPPVWNYKQSAFLSSDRGGIARDNMLTDECTVSFDVAWKGDSVRLRTILFSDDSSTDNPSSGIEVSFQRGSVHLRQISNQNIIGTAQSQVLVENDRVHVDIRVSRKANKVALGINGRVLEVWNNIDLVHDESDKALHFVSGSPQPLRLSNIQISPWDGVIEKMPTPQFGFGMMRMGVQGANEPESPAEDAGKDDKQRMELTNGDTLTGEVTSINEGVVSIKTPLGDFNLPASRLRTIALKPVDAERAIRRNGDVRAWFPDGSSVVFRLDAGGDGTLSGSSQNFGSAVFDLSAFNRIEFNIYSPEFEDLRAGSDW